MSLLKKVTIILLFWGTGCSTGTSQNKETQSNDAIVFTLKEDQSKQVITGFGASDAWSTQFIGKNWPLRKRKKIADLLFSKEPDADGNPKGIGLSIWRFNIGAGSARQGDESGISDPWRRAESFLDADSSYNWNKQQGQQWFLKAAKERGVEQFIGFANSPPVLLTENDKAYGDGGNQANIPPSNYDAYGDYLTKIALHFKSEGIPFDYISPVNEPQWDWSKDNNQEGSPYQNGEIANLTEVLDKKIQQNNLQTKIELPEAARINFLYNGDLSGRNQQTSYFFGKDSKVKNLPSLAHKIAAHSYFTTWPVEKMIKQREELKDHIQSVDPSLQYWMSEYCILADNDEIQGNSRNLGINPALYIARLIHYDLTVANASSWQWWLSVSPYDYKDGLIYIDKNTNDGQIYDSKMLWALGNYSRFIRPGAVRLAVNRSDSLTPYEAARQIMVSAYKDKNGSVAVVAINYSINDQKIKLKISGQQSSEEELTPYVTSSQFNLEPQQPIGLEESTVVPARSIVTFISDTKS